MSSAVSGADRDHGAEQIESGGRKRESRQKGERWPVSAGNQVWAPWPEGIWEAARALGVLPNSPAAQVSKGRAVTETPVVGDYKSPEEGPDTASPPVIGK